MPILVGGPSVWPSIKLGSGYELEALLAKDRLQGVGLDDEQFVCLDPFLPKDADPGGKTYPSNFWTVFVAIRDRSIST